VYRIIDITSPTRNSFGCEELTDAARRLLPRLIPPVDVFFAAALEDPAAAR
jgi:hypothetical protein